MIREGIVDGREVYRCPDSGLWYVRVPAEQGGFGSVHDLHKRVCIGSQSSFSSATNAIKRMEVASCISASTSIS